MSERPIFNRQDVVDLVKSFAGSGDLRLRANGIQALAVLSAGTESELAAMAEPELIEAITSAPSTSDGETMSRFRDRVMAALQGLGPDRARRVLQSLRERYGATRDSSRRTSLGWLLLSAMASGMSLQPSWLELRRLMRSTQAVKITRVLMWSTLTVVVAYLVVMGISAAAGLETERRGNSGWIVPIACVLISALAYFSPIGRFDVARHVHVIDTAIWAAVFAALSAIGAALLLANDLSPYLRQLPYIAVLGALVGAGIYALRRVWPADRPWEVLGATVVATVFCMLASYCGLDGSLVGASWLVLAPSGGIAAGLAGWVETKGPSAPPRNSKHADTVSNLLKVASGVVVIVVAWHFVQMSGLVSRWLMTVRADVISQSGTIPRRVDISVSQKDTYTIHVAPNDKDLDVCLVIDVKGTPVKTVNNGGNGASEETTLDLPSGTHELTIGDQSESVSCGATDRSSSLVERVAVMLSGGGGTSLSRGIVTVRVFPASKRPPNLPTSTPAK